MRAARKRFLSRFRGALLGAAVGDALGFPYQSLSRTYLSTVAHPLAERFERPSGSLYPTGQFTDDTQTALAVIDALVEQRDVDAKVVVEHLIPLWRDLLLVDPDPESSSAMRRVVKGLTAWDNAALGTDGVGSGSLSRAVPLGLWNVHDPERVAEHVPAVIGLTHRNPTVMAVAAATAAAIAHNAATTELVLGELLDRMAAASGVFDKAVTQAVLEIPRLLSQAESRAVEMIEVLAPRANQATATLLFSLYYFLKSPHDYTRVVERSIRIGGMTSTTAAIAGALSGSFVGIEELPESLVSTLAGGAAVRERADELFALVDRLAEARAAPRAAGSPNEGDSCAETESWTTDDDETRTEAAG